MDAAYKIIEENEGAMAVADLHQLLLTRKPEGGRTRDKATQLSKSDFIQKMRASPIHTYTDGVVMNRDLTEVAKRWMGFTHPLRPRNKLPALMLREVERLERAGNEE
tara:strand:- start:6142 stop:6462 length:321 start_codon:yes stop_codon:yes gene_type:complete